MNLKNNMSKYTSKTVTIEKPINEVFSAISDLSSYQARLDSLPAEAREKIGTVKFEEDTIKIEAAPVGEICFKVVERVAPNRVVLESAQSPVPLQLSVDLAEASASSTDVKAEIDVDIPIFLRPIVGGKLQEAADQFGNLIKSFFA